MINNKDFDSNLLKIDKKSNKNNGTYYIGYITDKNKEVLVKYTEFCDGIKNLIKKIKNDIGYFRDILKILVLNMHHIFAMVVMV